MSTERHERSGGRGERSGGDRPERSGGGGGSGGPRRSFGGFRGHNKSCPFSNKFSPKIDYKDVNLLRRFISERGKMMPSRITAVCAKKQRELAKAVKRARFLALLPYVDKKAG